MSHAYLFLKAANNPLQSELLDLGHREHLDVAMQRLNEMQRVHRARIEQADIDRKIITGDIWLYPPAPDERRVTLSTGASLVNLGAAMLLPRPPTITITPASQEQYAQVEADIVQRWIYAALDNISAYSYFNDWAKEEMFGVGFMHLIPDQLAKPDEVPIMLDVPDARSVLYHTGARGKLDYCFIRHEMTEAELGRMYGAYTKRSDNDLATRETFCYYAEERFRVPETNQVEARILYGIIGSGEWIYPLTDITEMLPEIPIFHAFNSDGFNWRGNEEVRARGIYTQEQEALLVASDMFSQLVNGAIRTINPALGRWSDPNTEPRELDMSPGAVNDLVENERIEALTQGKPDPFSAQMFPQVMEQIARGTNRQILLNAKDLDGVSGAAFVENLQPETVRNQVRQQNLAVGMRHMLRTFVRHMAAVMDQDEGMELEGVDYRDMKQIVAMAHPDMLLRNKRIQVKLSQQTPRSVWQYLNVIKGLGDSGYLPRQLVTEQTAELLQLPVTDMSSIMGQIASDDHYKIQLDVLRAKAAEAAGYLRQEIYNRQEQPGLLMDGSAPVGMSSEMLDPVMQGEMAPQTMQPVGPVGYGAS